MKIRYFLVFIFALGVLIQTSCNKTSNALPYYKLSAEFKAYCLFQTGSSWQYQNSLLQNPSTVRVTNIQENKWLNTFNEKYNYEAIDMLMADNTLNISMIELTAGSTLNSTSKMNSLMWLFFSNGDYRLIFAPKYPLGEAQILGDHEGVYTNVEIIASMTMGNNTYTDVYHTHIKDEFNNGMGDFDCYIAKNYGLIKLQNIIGPDTTVINLLDSSLHQ